VVLTPSNRHGVHRPRWALVEEYALHFHEQRPQSGPLDGLLVSRVGEARRKFADLNNNATGFAIPALLPTIAIIFFSPIYSQLFC